MKKKTIFLGALLASASLMFLSSCVHKPANKTTNTVTTPVTTDTTPVTNTGTDPVTTGTKPVTTAVVEDTYVETALFNNALLRITIADKKIDTIESIGAEYVIYKPVYINNKIAFLRALNTRTITSIQTKYYEVELNNLFDDIIFHVDENNNFSIIENKISNMYYLYNFSNGKGVNKLTVSADGKITKNLSTSTKDWNPIVTDNSVSFSGKSSGKNVDIDYSFTDSNVNATFSKNGVIEQQFELTKEANKIRFTLEGNFENFDYKYDLNADGLISRGENTIYSEGETTKVVYEYNYNSNKRLFSINCPTTSEVETFEYDDKNRLTKDTNGTSSIISYTYDDKGILVSQKDISSPYGNTYTIESYNDNLQKLQELEIGGHGKHRYIYTYDALGRNVTYFDNYYPNPELETYVTLYESGHAYIQNGEIQYSYQFGTDGKILNGSKNEYEVEGNKEINRYYSSTGVRDVWNIKSETSYEETETGSISETISYNAGVKKTRKVVTETVDTDGNPLTITRESKFDGDTEYDVMESTFSIFDTINGSILQTVSYDGVLASKSYTIKKAGVIDYIYAESYANGHINSSTKASYAYDEDGNKVATRTETSKYEEFNDEYLVSEYKDSRCDTDGTVYYEETIVYEYNLDNMIDTETITLSKKNVLGSMVETNKYVVHSYNYVSGSFHEYIWNYNVASDETKTHSYDLSLFYDSEGKIWKQLRFIYSGDTIIEDPSQTEYYKYNGDGTLSQTEIIEGASDVISDYIYEDGKLVKITHKKSENGYIIAETDVNDFGHVETKSSSYIDSNDEEVISIEKKYTINLFGELVLYKITDYNESSNADIIAGTKVITSRRGVETVFAYDIYTGYSYMEEQISKFTAYTYNDGEKDIIGYYQETDRHYFEDMTLKTNDRKKYTLDGVLMSKTTSSTVRTDIDTITSTTITYAEDGETPTMTEIGVVEYEYGTNNQISSKMTRIDHTKNDETTNYVWNYTTGEWELVE